MRRQNPSLASLPTTRVELSLSCRSVAWIFFSRPVPVPVPGQLPGLSKKVQLRKVFIQMGTDQPSPMDTVLTCCANIICSSGSIWDALHWLHCSKLADMDTFSKSDPFAVLFIQVRRTKYNLKEVWTNSCKRGKPGTLLIAWLQISITNLQR